MKDCRDCKNHKTMNCPNSSECYNTKEKPNYVEKDIVDELASDNINLAKKMILIAIMVAVIILLTGCEKRECIKSHTEEGRCLRYSYMYNGKTMIAIPHYYPCTKTVCDEWEVTDGSN